MDTAIAAENKGYQMMLRMGWGGRGLGRHEDGETPLHRPMHGSGPGCIVYHLSNWWTGPWLQAERSQ